MIEITAQAKNGQAYVAISAEGDMDDILGEVEGIAASLLGLGNDNADVRYDVFASIMTGLYQSLEASDD